MPRSGFRTVWRYSDQFKLTAVRLSQQPGIQVQTVSASLAIHPFMLSKWRKDVRDGPPRSARRRDHRPKETQAYRLVAARRKSDADDATHRHRFVECRKC
jgi:transposase-like protein